MKFLDILKTVGTGVLSTVCPGAGLIIGAVNKFLPKDNQLPETATGTELNNAVASLPPSQRAELMSQEFDVKITRIKEAHSSIRAMLESESAATHTTRPYIAKGAFQIIAVVTLTVLTLWSYAVGTGDAEMVKTIMDGWPFILSVTATLAALLKSYFGILADESKDRLDAANGVAQPKGLAGIISAFVKR